MAEIVQIDDIVEHTNADSLEICIVDGWRCITRKGEFRKGEIAVFIQPDAWVPNELAPFLSKIREPRVFNGVKGEKLRTVRLRQVVSQGLLLKVQDAFKNVDIPFAQFPNIGDDVSELLNIQKWEAPIPSQLAGVTRGNFPSWGRKTDQERIQSVFKKIRDYLVNDHWVVEEKLDGSSASFGKYGDEIVVCSRNLSLKYEDEDNQRNNTFVRTAIELNIVEGLKSLNKDIMVSGELIGPGIQGNKYNLDSHQWHIFDVYDCNERRYMHMDDRLRFIGELSTACGNVLKIAPIIHDAIKFDQDISVDQLIDMAKGFSVLNDKQMREGLVVKNLRDPDLSFKAISPEFLLKYDD